MSRCETLRLILDKFRFVRKLYHSTKPHFFFPNEIKELKRTAVEMGNFLKDDFGCAHWPYYLHKVIKHSQELIGSGASTIGGQ